MRRSRSIKLTLLSSVGVLTLLACDQQDPLAKAGFVADERECAKSVDADQCRQMLRGRGARQLSRAMDFDSLHHRFGAEPGVGFAAGILDRINGRACQEEDAFGEAAFFGIGQVQPDVPLVQRAGPNDHGRFAPGKRTGQDMLGSNPFRAVRPKEWKPGFDRRGLAEIDAIQARK